MPTTLQRVDPSFGADMSVEDVRLLQQKLHGLEAIHHFDEPRVVIEERAVRHAAEALAKFCEFGVGAGRAHGLGHMMRASAPTR